MHYYDTCLLWYLYAWSNFIRFKLSKLLENVSVTFLITSIRGNNVFHILGHVYSRRQNKLCVPFRLNAASYFLPAEIKRKWNGTEQNGTCEKTERTKCVDLNKVQNDLPRY